MGSQQVLLIVLSIVIVGVSIAGGLIMFQRQKEAFESHQAKSLLLEAGQAMYRLCITPKDLGGFDGNIRQMKEQKTYVRSFLPPIDENLRDKVTINRTYVNGYRLILFGYYRKIAIGIRFKKSRKQYWVLVHCDTGDIEIKNERPRSRDFKRPTKKIK